MDAGFCHMPFLGLLRIFSLIDHLLLVNLLWYIIDEFSQQILKKLSLSHFTKKVTKHTSIQQVHGKVNSFEHKSH